MKTLQIDEQHAMEMYSTAAPEFKMLLEDTFGKEFFFQKITDRIKTFEDALKEYGKISENIAILLSYNGVDEEMLASVALAKISIIKKVLNEGWTPNWEDSNEYKYYPYFSMRSGVGVSYNDYYSSFSDTCVGSRLVYRSSELAIYAGKQFIDIYKNLLS